MTRQSLLPNSNHLNIKSSLQQKKPQSPPAVEENLETMGDESECLDADENVPIAATKKEDRLVFTKGAQKSPLTSRDVS